jgi:hypothetical protein
VGHWLLEKLLALVSQLIVYLDTLQVIVSFLFLLKGFEFLRSEESPSTFSTEYAYFHVDGSPSTQFTYLLRANILLQLSPPNCVIASKRAHCPVTIVNTMTTTWRYPLGYKI